MKQHHFTLGFDLQKTGDKRQVRKYLVSLLNEAQKRFEFGVFQTNATNFHENGCIYVIYKGNCAKRRTSDTVIDFWEYKAATPSTFSHKMTPFDVAYAEAREFIKTNCHC